MIIVTLISIYVGIFIYYLYLCSNLSFCKVNDRFKLPIDGFYTPFTNIFSGNVLRGLYIFFSLKSPYLFIIISIILGLSINYFYNKYIDKIKKEEKILEESLENVPIELSNEESKKLRKFKNCIIKNGGNVDNPSLQHLEKCTQDI